MSKIAVIGTRFPYIDRRALSEAWFSALRLGNAAPPGIPRVKPTPHNARFAATVARVQVKRGVARDAATAAEGRRAPLARAGAGMPPASEMHRTPDLDGTSVDKVARIAHDRARSYPPFRTSLTFGVDGGRVHLLLRRDGATLYVVALCRPEMAGVVRQALARADAHVRANGEVLRAAVQTLSEKEA